MICENMSIWCWLIPVIVGIICAILGYLLGRLFGKGEKLDNSNEINKYKTRISNLESDLADCKENRKSDNSNEINSYKTKISNLENDLALCKVNKSSKFADSTGANTLITSTFDADAAKLVFGKKIKENDLKIVEGIGPKIEGLFHNFGVKTWKALSETSLDKCQEVLNSGGDRYRIHKPTTWPKQAGLAAEGKFKELLKWQDELDGGK